MNDEKIWTILGTICSIIGVFYLIYQFGYLPKKEDNNAKLNLLVFYRTNQRLIDDLIFELNLYSKSNRGTLFSRNLTFEGYIKYLEDMKATELNEDLYAKIKNENLSTEQCAIMLDSLQKQKHSFNESMMYLKTNFGIY